MFTCPDWIYGLSFVVVNIIVLMLDATGLQIYLGYFSFRFMSVCTVHIYDPTIPIDDDPILFYLIRRSVRSGDYNEHDLPGVHHDVEQG